MKLRRYLRRIGFGGSVRPSPAALAELLRSHVLSVPFENLDVQLGTSLTTDVDAAFDKIVTRRRGGWCYEQNGVFGWALAEAGFEVTRVAAAVRRAERGAAALANHLFLLVRVPDAPGSVYLADVGFGGSMIRPIPLAASWHEQAPFRLGLRQLEDGHWQFVEECGADSMSYDFVPVPGDEAALAAKCSQLQTDPESSFVQNFVAQQRLPDSHISLRGRVLTVNSAAGKETRTLQSPDEFAGTLAEAFRLDVREAADLWPAIVARHEILFGDQQ